MCLLSFYNDAITYGTTRVLERLKNKKCSELTVALESTYRLYSPAFSSSYSYSRQIVSLFDNCKIGLVFSSDQSRICVHWWLILNADSLFTRRTLPQWRLASACHFSTPQCGVEDTLTDGELLKTLATVLRLYWTLLFHCSIEHYHDTTERYCNETTVPRRYISKHFVGVVQWYLYSNI